MLSNEKNSFEKICDRLEEKNIMNENKIIIVREYLVSELKISKNKDVLLRIKAEAEECDYGAALSQIISMFAMFFAAIGTIIQLTSPTSGFIDTIIKIGYLLAIIVVLIPVFTFYSKFYSVRKWRSYILNVINQLMDEKSERKEWKQHIEQKETQNKNVKSNKRPGNRRKR